MDEKKKLSLDDSDMITERPIGRRASVAVVGAVLIGAAGIVATTPSRRTRSIPGVAAVSFV